MEESIKGWHPNASGLIVGSIFILEVNNQVANNIELMYVAHKI